MTTCLDVRNNTSPSAYFSPNLGSGSQWPDKMISTYLWALGIETDSCISGHDSDTNCSCGPASFAAYSEPSSPASSSFAPAYEMTHPSLSSGDCIHDDSSTASQRPSLLALTRLRHSASCDTGLRHSLPASPRHPRLVPLRSLSPCLMKQPVQKSAPPAEISSRDARGRSIPSTRPPSLAITPLPTIILSPPTSRLPSRLSFASAISSASASDYPSEHASSFYDDCESTSESSESALSDSLGGDRMGSVTGPMLARVLDSFRKNTPEETDVPLKAVSESAFKFVSTSQPEREVILLDASEIVRARSLVHPGAHGWVIPGTPSLTDVLAQHAQSDSNGGHLFIRQRAMSQARYQYLGMYKVAQKVIHGPEMSEMWKRRPIDHNPFFLQFLRYDWELFWLMDRFTASEVPVQRDAVLQSSESSDSSQAYLDHGQSQRSADRSHARIVTIGGVDFEMAPSPIAWDHGSFKE